MKKDCTKYLTWCAKKGDLILICSEGNLTYVPLQTWWIETNTTIHISVSMHNCLRCRKPIDNEKFVYTTDGTQVKVKVIGDFSFIVKH